MGVLYQDAERPSDGKMEGSDSLYVRGQQIMSVSTFVKEIESLRIHREAEGRLIRHTDDKIFASHMLPVVLVEIDTPSIIRRKIAALKKSSSTVRNRIVSSSESEEEADDSKLPAVSSPRTLSSAPPASSRTSNHSDGSDSETKFSEDDFLPDLLNITDPSYDTSRKSIPKKTKLLQGHPVKKRRYVKKFKAPKLFKGGDGKLMKAAKQVCLEKQKMFAKSDKGKRVFKSGQENDKTALTGEQPKDSKNHEYKFKQSFSTSHHFKTTRITEFKPFAKSPKDVERKLTTSSDMTKHVSDLQDINRGNNKEEAVAKRCELRMLLQKRLESPPPVKSGESPKDPEPEIPGLSGETSISQEASNCDYDSDETVIYEETVIRNSGSLLAGTPPEQSSTRKRSSSDDRDDNKKLKTAAESSHGLRIVPSPVPFVEQSSYNRETDGEQQIKIQQVEGGVTDAFESPDLSSKPEIKKLKLLKVKMEMKTALEKRLNTAKEIHEENLRKEKAAYERRIRSEERRYQSEVTIIEKKKQKLDDEINSILMHSEENVEGGTADASPTLSVILPVPDKDNSQPQVGPAEGLLARLPKTKVNIIKDASVSRFGTSQNSVPASGCQQVNVEESPPKPKRGRPRKIKPIPRLDVSSLPPVQSVAPVTAPSQPMMFKPNPAQPCPNVVVSSGIPVSGPVLVNAMNPVVTDSQRISFIDKPPSVAQFLGSAVPLLSIPSTTQLSSASQTSPHVSVSMGSAARLAQPQKSHLLVAAQPAITSGSATQAKALPSNSSVTTPHPVTKTEAVYGDTSKHLILSKPDHFSPNDEERSSSPENGESCFLCGSPSEFECCNGLMYCSADCKSKDWGRHAGECAHNSNK
ncbi:nucleolar protein dao-5-like isoform X7 [Macrobrachium rosenbergii]|uniref:nucleolar protein dao-5-like isoform X7 n=1 Tax=Macrobrachium rosenbergii TaxID=79674 RepID=UPI0034D73224